MQGEPQVGRSGERGGDVTVPAKVRAGRVIADGKWVRERRKLCLALRPGRRRKCASPFPVPCRRARR